MRSFARLDDTLIDQVFQPLVDWIAQHLACGWSRMACISTDLSALAWVLSQADGLSSALGFQDAAGGQNSGSAGLKFALIVVGLGSIMVLRTLFQRAGGGKAGLGGNPLRTGMQVHRGLCLFWLVALSIKTASAPVGLEAWALLAVGIFGTIAVYLAACSNRPPKRQDSRATDHGWRLAGAMGR